MPAGSQVWIAPHGTTWQDAAHTTAHDCVISDYNISLARNLSFTGFEEAIILYAAKWSKPCGKESMWPLGDNKKWRFSIQNPAPNDQVTLDWGKTLDETRFTEDPKLTGNPIITDIVWWWRQLGLQCYHFKAVKNTHQDFHSCQCIPLTWYFMVLLTGWGIHTPH